MPVALLVPSVTVKVNESVPVKFAAGVYLNAPVPGFVTVTDPFLGALEILKVSASPSMSLACNVPLAGVFFVVVRVPFVGTGASFTGVIVILIVPRLESAM